MAVDAKYGKIIVEHDSARNPLNDSDEPVFVLRATDKLAISALIHYHGLMMGRGVEDDYAETMNDVIDRFENWQNENAKHVHLPDPLHQGI